MGDLLDNEATEAPFIGPIVALTLDRTDIAERLARWRAIDDAALRVREARARLAALAVRGIARAGGSLPRGDGAPERQPA